MRDRLRSALCRLFGHRPMTVSSHDQGIRRSITSCRRCDAPLDFVEHVGIYPLPAERVKVAR